MDESFVHVAAKAKTDPFVFVGESTLNVDEPEEPDASPSEQDTSLPEPGTAVKLEHTRARPQYAKLESPE